MESLTPAVAPPTPRWIRWTLAGLLAWSLALRVLFASVGLHAERFWDERYSLENVVSILRTGSLRPASGWYPSLAYLPQTALLAASQGLHRVTGREALAVFDEAGGFTPTAYFLCRLLQAIYGTLSLLVTFCIGRRLFSPGIGLLAAALLAVVPQHIRLSAFFKPDVLLLLLGLAAVYWALRAAGEPGLRPYLASGLALGLAASSKLNAGPYAIPLVGAALIRGWSHRRHWVWLLAAGALACLVFLGLNPYFPVYLEYFQKLTAQYAERGAELGGSRLGVLREIPRLLLSGAFHGPVVGALGLLGAVGLAASLGNRAVLPARRLQWGLLLACPVTYALLFAALTTYPKANHLLQLAPFMALLAAWVFVRLLERLHSWLPGRWRGLVPPAASLVLILPLFHSANLFTYRTVIPTTWALAAEFLKDRLAPLHLRVIYAESESAGTWLRVTQWKDQAAVIQVGELPQVGEEELDLADAEVFPHGRIQGDGEDFYARRILQVPREGSRVFSPGFWQARGEPLVVLAHPWSLADGPVRVALEMQEEEAGRSVGSARLPARFQPGDILSLALWLPRQEEGLPPMEISVGAVSLPLLSTRWTGRHDRYLTPRFRLREGSPELALPLPAEMPFDRVPVVEIRRWHRSGEEGTG